MVYCVVPPQAAGRVRRSIERGLCDRQGIEMVTERRGGERRARAERRKRSDGREAWMERRRIRYDDGRRVADRRVVMVPVAAPEELPRAVRQHSGLVSFHEALEVPKDFRNDVDAVRAVVRFQSGGDFAELYSRWFDPLYTYLAVTLDHGADVEGAVSAALAETFRALLVEAPGPTQLRPWLFGNAHRVACPSPAQPARRAPANGHPVAAVNGAVPVESEDSLEWLKDEELVLLVERRPAAERHVVVLRYFAGLSFTEIGDVMGMPAMDAVALHRSAVDSLDVTLSTATRVPRVQDRHPMKRLIHQTPTLRQRRRALLAV